MQLYGGYQLKELMAIELALDRYSGIDSGDILGSGVQRLNISADQTSVIARGVFSLPLEDMLRRHQKITLFGSIGLALGAGVIFEVSRMRLRATLQSLDREGPSLNSISVATEFRF